MRRYWTALLFIIISAICYMFLQRFLSASFSWLLTVIWMVLMLMIGYFLAPVRKKNARWLGKVIIAMVVVFIFGLRLDLFIVDEFLDVLQMVGLTGSFLDLLLVYCGWAFFQV